MTTKANARNQATKYRREHPDRKVVVNVVEVSKGNWGVRFSPKGKRDHFNYKKG